MEETLVDLLIVDDNDIDAEQILRNFEKLNLRNDCHRAVDGIEALDMLQGSNGKAPLPRPVVILLDLNMPRMNGLEFLAELRADPALATTPVIVVSTSDRDSDLYSARQYGVAGYIVKPFTVPEMLAVVANAGISLGITAIAETA